MVGRKNELANLERLFWNKETSLVLVTGIRGIGKTTLLREFAENKNAVYFTAAETAGPEELLLLAKALGRSVKFSYTNPEKNKVPGLAELLDDVSKRGEKEPAALIIDNYPYFVKADSDFNEILHDFLKNKWTDGSVTLILTGDSPLAMTKAVTGPKALLRDIPREEIPLGALSFYEARTFFPEAAAEDALFYYGLTGGIPAGLARIADSVPATAEELLLNEATAITPMSQMTDLRELSYYNQMLTAVAHGNSRVMQISAAVNKPKDIVVPYLTQMMDLDITEKIHTITEKSNRRKTRYGIKNLNHLFWYRYVAPHMDLYYEHDTKALWNKVILPEKDEFLRLVFVQVCKDFLRERFATVSPGFEIDEVGNWWENDEEKKTTSEFDLVARGRSNERPVMIFGRCYYSDTPVDVATLKGLIELAGHVNVDGEVYYFVFSRSGFHEHAATAAKAIKNIVLLSLDDICNIK